MSTTIIEQQFNDGDTPPVTSYINAIGGHNRLTNKIRRIAVNTDNGLEIAPSNSAADSFGRFRASLPHAIFDSKQIYAKDTFFWDEQLTGGATSTFLTNEATVQMQCGTASGDQVIRQTRQYIRYQPGRSQLVLLTGVLGAPKTNVRKRIGYFDANNGLFFEQISTGIRVVRRSSVTGSPIDTVVAQASWNVDPLDGTGPSGITLNQANAQIFVIDFGWLGVATARMGIMYNGEVRYCHEFINENSLTSVYMAVPNLPCRYEITNTGTAASATSIKQICAAVFSEGGLDPIGILANANTGQTTRSIGSSTTPLIAIRLKTAYIRATVIPLCYEVMTTSANNFVIEVWIRATVSGGSWTSASTAVEVNDNPTGITTTGALRLSTDYLNSNTLRVGSNLIKSLVTLNSNIAGTPDELVIAVTNVGGGNSNMCAAVTWQELY